jgi:hypothetical protein
MHARHTTLGEIYCAECRRASISHFIGVPGLNRIAKHSEKAVTLQSVFFCNTNQFGIKATLRFKK